MVLLSAVFTTGNSSISPPSTHFFFFFPTTTVYFILPLFGLFLWTRGSVVLFTVFTKALIALMIHRDELIPEARARFNECAGERKPQAATLLL